MKRKVAFICVHNSCRSQIAESLGKKYLSEQYDCYSAGTEVNRGRGYIYGIYSCDS